jgi:hypothetical protein
MFSCLFFAAAVLAVSVLAKDDEPEKLGTVIGIDLGKFFLYLLFLCTNNSS